MHTVLYKNRGNSHYVPLSWKDAFEIIAKQFNKTSPERSFFCSSGRSSNEAAFLLQLFARIYGTNNINNCSYREQVSRWVVLMNPSGIKKLGFKENDRVTLESRVGTMKKVAFRKFDIPEGNVMTYYPEANILVPTTVDPRSRTSAFKSVCIKIY